MTNDTDSIMSTETNTVKSRESVSNDNDSRRITEKYRSDHKEYDKGCGYDYMTIDKSGYENSLCAKIV